MPSVPPAALWSWQSWSHCPRAAGLGAEEAWHQNSEQPRLAFSLSHRRQELGPARTDVGWGRLPSPGRVRPLFSVQTFAIFMNTPLPV